MILKKWLEFFIFMNICFAGFMKAEPGSNILRKDFEPKSVESSIVYEPGYNIKLGSVGNIISIIQKIQKPLPVWLHIAPQFDGSKYGRIVSILKSNGINIDNFHKPEITTYKELEKIHSKKYLDSLQGRNSVVAQTLDLPDQIGWLDCVPFISKKINAFFQKRLLKPMRLATGGTVLAAKIALRNEKSAINIGGGYHHASKNGPGEPGGFCFFGDTQLAIKNIWNEKKRFKLLKKNSELKMMIIDFDAHHGNGYAQDFKNEKRVVIFDIYNRTDYPYNDKSTVEHIKYKFPVENGISDKEYLGIIKNNLESAIAQEKPDLIFYTAGTDILEGDLEGKLNVSKDGIIKRDELVFAAAQKNGVPICMTTSGGYTDRSAVVIAESLINLIEKKFIEVEK
ncbi:histone deacetylase [Candidatus Pacearchaeota archaeon]|nr:histone deacetylase [Candidatus Pacearchaeota archaeon]